MKDFNFYLFFIVFYSYFLRNWFPILFLIEEHYIRKVQSAVARLPQWLTCNWWIPVLNIFKTFSKLIPETPILSYQREIIVGNEINYVFHFSVKSYEKLMKYLEKK